MREVDGRIVWAPRVPRHKIKRLYVGEAAGLLDEELCDDVAWAIWERCRDIITVTRAHTGDATCPRCEATIHGDRPLKDEVLLCSCGWTSTWNAYFRSYRKKQLVGGGAMPWVHEYADALPAAKTARERLLLIDRLISRWHWDMKHPERDDPRFFASRPAAVNVIGGTQREILELMDDLAGFPSSDPELRENRAAYDANRAESFARWPR